MSSIITVTVIDDPSATRITFSRSDHEITARVPSSIIKSTARKSGDWGHELNMMIRHEMAHHFPEISVAAIHLV